MFGPSRWLTHLAQEKNYGDPLYLATNKGVPTVQDSRFGEWALESKGLDSWAIPGLAVDESTHGRAYVAKRDDGVLRSDDSGKSWYKPNRGERGPGKIRCVTVSGASEMMAVHV
jgi:hypothetical protein